MQTSTVAAALGILLGLSTNIACAQSTPTYLLEHHGCGVLVSGSVGSTFAESDVAGIWHNVNKDIADHLHEHLLAEKYRVERLTVSVAESPDISRLVVYSLARNRCNRVLQISNDVGEDSNGRYFGFIVSLIRMVPASGEPAAGGTKTTAKGEYLKSYRYPRTKETLDTFYTGTFARKVFDDLAATGALDAMR